MKKTLLLSAFGLSTTAFTFPAVAQANTPSQPRKPSQIPIVADSLSTDNIASTETKIKLSKSSFSIQSITQIHNHKIAGKSATTLYIRTIPVLTFIGEIDNKTTEERANQIAQQINQIATSQVEPNQIIVTRKQAHKSNQVGYFIAFNGQELIEIDENTRLPDTTNNIAQDALQVTNRMRRLLGKAQPLSSLSGQFSNISNTTNSTTEIAVIYQQSNNKIPNKIPSKKLNRNQTPRKQTPTKLTKPKNQDLIATNTRVRSTYTGMASFYSYEGSRHLRTANGERFNPHQLTAAHRTLPFGTKVRVTNTYNGRSVVVRINDRGPFIGGRIIDVSLGAARQIGMVSSGIARVRVDILQ